jgi:Zn-dependent protease
LDAQQLAAGLTTYVVLLFSLSFHEAAHAWMAYKLGDDTAHRDDRVSLNPLVHIDPIGTVLMPLLQIFWGGIPLLAWAKPTPYNPANFHREHSMRKGHVLVASAGPVSNLILAVVGAALFLGLHGNVSGDNGIILSTILFNAVILNVSLAVFNLVPIPPLDGSKVASHGLPRNMGERYDSVMEPYGQFILLALVLTGLIRFLIGPVIQFVYRLLLNMAN